MNLDAEVFRLIEFVLLLFGNIVQFSFNLHINAAQISWNLEINNEFFVWLDFKVFESFSDWNRIDVILSCQSHFCVFKDL